MLAFLLSMTFFITVRWMCEQRRQEEESRMIAKEKPHKMGLALPHLFKMLWFVSVVSYEWQTLWDMPWLPKYLGGKGEPGFFWQGSSEELTTFYEIQLAYHAHSMLFAFIVGAKLEMHLHHLVTILLIYLSDAMGYRRIGAVVFTLHDTPDIVGCAIKAAVVAEEKTLAVGIYVALLGAWGYFRLYLLPMVIIDVVQSNETFAVRTGFSALLSILVLLHYFWYMQFLIMGYNMRRTGKTRDISETVEHPADKAARAVLAGVGTGASAGVAGSTAVAATAAATGNVGVYPSTNGAGSASAASAPSSLNGAAPSSSSPWTGEAVLVDAHERKRQ